MSAMEIDKQAPTTKLLWVDLEMTGLDIHDHVIIEVAAKVTDWNFTVLGSYEAVIHQSDEVLARSNSWAAEQHAKSGLTERVREQGRLEKTVVEEFAAFIKDHFAKEPAVLAGNSIHNDRQFIKHWWPEVDALLHYRMLDVSSWKLVMQGKYGVTFDKTDNHRALEDIEASIAELQYYLDIAAKSS